MDVTIEHQSHYLYINMSGDGSVNIPPEGHPASVASVCQDEHCRRLLVDIRQLTDKFGTMECFSRGQEIARAFAYSGIHIAIVGVVECSELLSFLENVVTNRGVNLRVFTDFARAKQWLLE